MDKSFEKFRLFFAPRKSCFRPTSLWIEAKIEVHCHATILALTQNRHQKYYCDCVWQNVTAKVKANHLRSLMLFSRLFNWVSLFWNALNATTLMLQRRVEFFFRIDVWKQLFSIFFQLEIQSCAIGEKFMHFSRWPYCACVFFCLASSHWAEK